MPRLILVFWLARLRALVGKIVLFVIIGTDCLAQVSIFPTHLLVAATIILSRGFGCVDPSGRSRGLRHGAMGAVIATILIAPIFLVVSARFFGLGRLEAITRHGLCLLEVERKRALVPGVILGRFQGKVVVPGAASIHLTDPQREVYGGLGLGRDSFLDGLVSSVFSTTFLLVLGMDRGP